MDDITALLQPRPNRPLPQADLQRTALLDEMRATPPAGRGRRRVIGRLRVPAPMLAAGALAATLAVVAVGTAVTGPDTEKSVVPATSTSASLAGFLQRVDEAVDSQPKTVVGAKQFLYLRSLSEGAPSRTREEWHSADGAVLALLEGDDKTVDVYPGGEQPPAGMPALDAAIQYPDSTRLSALTNVEPAVLLAAINRLSAPGAPPSERAFDRVRTILTSGGLAFPDVRAALYHVVALIPGVRYEPDGVDLLGRHGAVLSLPVGRPSWDLVVNPDTGALLGSRDTAYQRYAVVDRIGARPEGRSSETTPPEKPEDRTVRGLDYANQTFVMPADEHFGNASPSDGSSLPVLEFHDGVATRRDAAGRTVRYEIVGGRPVGFANLLDRIEGPVLVLSVRESGRPVASAVLFMDFSHAGGTPTQLVAWVPSAGEVSVRISGTTVVVTPSGSSPQEYRWRGDRFARTN